MHINIGASGHQADQRVDKLVEGHTDLVKEIQLTDEWVDSIEKQVEALNHEVASLIRADVQKGLDSHDLKEKIEALKKHVGSIPQPEKVAPVDLTQINREIALLRARVSEIKPVSLIPVYTQISRTADALREKIDLEIAKVPTETDIPATFKILIGLNLLVTVGVLIHLFG